MLYAKVKTLGNDHYLKVNNIYTHQNTPYQEILVADVPNHGKTLILDDELQSSQLTYKKYHEAMIMPYTPQPNERVLVLGAGEGVLIDLLLRKGWKNIDALELDEHVIPIYDEHLSDWNNHIYKRTDEYNLIIGDGLKHLKSTPNSSYSYILLDYPSKSLDSSELIYECHRTLLTGGVLTIQDGDNLLDSINFNYVKEHFKNPPQRKAVQDWSFLHVIK